jgi:hypothetical protein
VNSRRRHYQDAAKKDLEDAFLRFHGIARAVFQSLGGGEAFIQHEREHFYDRGPFL